MDQKKSKVKKLKTRLRELKTLHNETEKPNTSTPKCKPKNKNIPDEDIQFQKQVFQKLIGVESALESGNIVVRRRKISVLINSYEHDQIKKPGECKYRVYLTQKMNRVVKARLLNFGFFTEPAGTTTYILSLNSELDDTASSISTWNSSVHSFFSILSTRFASEIREYSTPKDIRDLTITITNSSPGPHIEIPEHWLLFEFEVEEMDQMFQHSIPTRQKN